MALLSACTTNRDVEAALARQVGQPVDTVIARMGFPTDERLVDGRRLLFWTNRFTSVRPATPGYVYGGVRGGVVIGGGNTVVPYACDVALAVDDAGVVTDYQLTGDVAACNRFLRALGD